MHRFLCYLGTIFFGGSMFFHGSLDAAPKNGNGNSVEVGYAVITPTDGSSEGLVVFETFGMKQGNGALQAGVLPARMSTNALFFVNTSGKLSRNLGVAISNPAGEDATVTLILKDQDGSIVAEVTLVVAAGQQTARFVTELFEDQPSVPQDLIGTLAVVSDKPVALLGLRFRGINFSTLPVTSLPPFAAVPEIDDGIGGAEAIILPHFAAGGGWATEIVIVNSGETPVTVRVDLFQQDGSPLVAELNGETASSFAELEIPPGGVLTLSSKDNAGHSPF